MEKIIMKLKRKIILIMTLAMVIVGTSFYFFSEEKENFLPSKNFESPKTEISVYISGQVKNSAVITFKDEENLKIIDAVNAAGGLTEFADTEVINLSEPLIDGQHIHIPTKKIFLQENSSADTKNNSSSSSELININTADENELQKIKGVGPGIAKRILDFREQNGNFKTIDDIKKVRGIGEKKFEKMKDFITVQ